MTIPIPNQSTHGFNPDRDFQNPGLIFERFAPDWSVDETAKKTGLMNVITSATHVDTTLLSALNDRWVKGVFANHAAPFSIKTEWRLIAGLGRKGSLEVGFTFNLYGFPILPGSSLKGLARAFGLAELSEHSGISIADLDNLLAKETDEEYQTGLDTYQISVAIQSEFNDFRLIFGTQEYAGKAIFFDAIPVKKPKLMLDIMNPHYPRFYQGSEPPTNWQSPIPIYFITVAPQVEFHFAVGWRSRPENQAEIDQQKKAVYWLQKGLTDLGAGAKTSAGYGYFTENSLVLDGVTPEISTSVITPEPSKPILPTLIRRGKVRPQPPKIFIIDSETEQRYTTDMSVLRVKGKTPKQGTELEFVIQDGEVLEIRN